MVRAGTAAILAIVAALTLTPELQAQHKQGKRKETRAEVQAQPEVAGFSAAEQRIIVEFFVQHPFEAKPLPPGIAKNLARGKPLPPGIAKTRIPAALQARLPTHAGVEITIFGDRIVLLEASGLVVDVLQGIFK